MVKNSKKEHVPANKMRVDTIWVPAQMDLFEWAALWLLQETTPGHHRFDGIEKASVQFWGKGVELVEDLTWDVHKKQDTLLLGVGLSPFDPNNASNRHAGLPVSSIVARVLDITTERKFVTRFSQFVQDLQDEYLDRRDTRLRCLRHIIRDLYRSADDTETDHGRRRTFEDIREILFPIFDAIVQRQDRYLDAKQEYKQALEDGSSRYTEILGPDEKKFHLRFIDSVNPEIATAALNTHKREIAAVVVRSDHEIHIIPNGKLEGVQVKFDHVARAVRLADLKKDGVEVKDAWQPLLTLPGQLPFVPQWQFHPNGTLLSGSEKCPDGRKTQLKPAEIKKILQDNIRFEAAPKAE